MSSDTSFYRNADAVIERAFERVCTDLDRMRELNSLSDADIARYLQARGMVDVDDAWTEFIAEARD